MERKFYPENFERFLKGHADQFKMTPSKKVWHGIYNDLHPGRRWPSVAMTMVFIFTLVIIGHLNTNNGDKTLLPDLSSLQNTNQLKNTSPVASPKSLKRSDTKVTTDNTPGESLSEDITEANVPLLTAIKETETVLKETEVPVKTETESDNKADKNIVLETKVTEVSPENGKNDVAKVITKNMESTISLKEPSEIINNEEILITPVANVDEAKVTEKKNNSELLTEPATVKISKPKKTSNVSWGIYIAPSSSYRIISDKINNSVIHKSRLGYEAGTEISLKLFRKLQLTSGLQVNYSGYNITAVNTHPVIATLVLSSDVQQGQFDVFSTMSTYGNSTGAKPINLKNYSLQASVPIGLQYTIAGNENFKLGLAASFQPSFVIASQAYFLSEDKRNYLKNSYLYRTWNMNTNLAPYVSISTSALNWQIGPQVRYQLLSTYTNRYGVKENLINYGLRIGITKGSK